MIRLKSRKIKTRSNAALDGLIKINLSQNSKFRLLFSSYLSKFKYELIHKTFCRCVSLNLKNN